MINIIAKTINWINKYWVEIIIALSLPATTYLLFFYKIVIFEKDSSDYIGLKSAFFIIFAISIIFNWLMISDWAKEISKKG